MKRLTYFIMRNVVLKKVVLICVASLSIMSCKRSTDEVWNDTQSAGRHVSRGAKTLGGKHGESREIKSKEEFAGAGSAAGSDFVGLDDEGQGQNIQVKDGDSLPQARETPGELGSAIPGIDAFKDPATDPALAEIFKHLHFDYNSSLVKSDEDLSTIQKAAEFLKARPNMYLFVEGHCDKRGPAAYNLALGANRANSVRNLLAKEGVDPERIFTISYGKDRQFADGDTEEFFRINRRAQFRIWER
ncbi:MAG TPA: OmpA family protein [Chlamydiales bacterium]|nr:OmpA family protein [Chlamydiales bacterium]